MCLKMLLIVLVCDALAQDYWSQLKKVADECFTGRNFTVTVGGGIEQRTFDNGSTTAPYAQLKMEVPLYSSKEIRSQKQAKAKFLEHGAELIRDLNKAQERLKIKKEEAEVLKTAMMQEGLQGIRTYFSIREEIENTRAEITSHRQKLEGWFLSCGIK